MVSVIENIFHVFKNKNKKNKTCSCSPVFLFFQNKNQFLNRFHVFVRECLVSVIENRFHFSRNKKKRTKLVLDILFSHVLFFFQNKNRFLNRFHVLVRNVWLVLLGL